MKKAINIARKATRAVIPNPKVGAIIVKDGKIISSGYHQKAGDPHAEINALKKAGVDAKGSTLYVTLEPCSTFGKTPPCVNEVIKAGIGKVVIGSLDPNPLNHKKSIEILNNNGIEVITGILQDKCNELIEDFRKYINTGLPFVIAKVAQSADGKISTADGDSKWISNEQSRKKVQIIRSNVDAIMVGVNTVIKDNPHLTLRIKNSIYQPWRIVIDPDLIIPDNSNVTNDSYLEKTVIITRDINTKQDKSYKLADKGIKVLGIESESDKFSSESILLSIAKFPILSILLEGGHTTLGRFLDDKAIDKIHLFIAPIIIGDKYAPSSFCGDGVKLIKDAIKLDKSTWKKYNNDMLLTGYPIYK